jgi:hypothetical protein
MTAATAALALMAASAPRAVHAHGYLALPAARNVQHNSEYCPHCLNAGGPWQVYAQGPGRPRYGVCGDPYTGPRHHEAGGRYATPPRIAGIYRSGGALVAKVVLTANHKGRWSLRLCPVPGDGSPRNERLTQACFDKHLLWRADGRGPFTPVSSTKNVYVEAYLLPKGLTCRRCVLQWTYETGNSCTPPGLQNAAGLPSCAASANGEMFWNCADIRIDGTARPDPGPGSSSGRRRRRRSAGRRRRRGRGRG